MKLLTRFMESKKKDVEEISEAVSRQVGQVSRTHVI
jgi:hypothetical protein